MEANGRMDEWVDGMNFNTVGWKRTWWDGSGRVCDWRIGGCEMKGVQKGFAGMG